MASKTPAERFVAPSDTCTYSRHNLYAERRGGGTEGTINTFGRTNAAERQAAANAMATITETAMIERIDPNSYRVHFAVTHRIIPIEAGA